MKKRLICAALILTLLLALLPAQALADDPQAITGKLGESITWTFAPIEGILTVDGTGDMPDWSYSEGAPWYLYRSRIFKVVLSKGITSIGAYAFNECARLTEIDASEATIGAIGEGAMNNCVLLETVSFLPAETLHVGADAFFGCAVLKTVNLGANEGSIGAGAFSGCSALEEVVLPKAAPALGDETFLNCAVLAKLNIPDGLTSIGKRCFSGCQALGDLSFPETLATVERYAFNGCKMENLTFAGDAPTFAPAKDVSASFSADTTLRVPYNAAGWTWPVCKGYETQLVYPDVTKVFKDLATGAWYIPSVQHVYYSGLMTGIKEDTFDPSGLVSRGQLVTVLYRLAGSPAVETENVFTDVPEKAFYYDAVRWAQSNNIVNGVTATTFKPNDKISRQQLCTVLYRYAAAMEIMMTQRDSLSSFTDAGKISAYARDAVSWCVAVGLINGKAAGVLDPTGNATRAEVAKVLTSFSCHINREYLTAPENWEQEILIPEEMPGIDREDPLYLYAREIFDAINAKRAESGLKSFIWNDRLYLAAQVRAKEISEKDWFKHNRPDGSYYDTVLTEYEVNTTVRNEIIAHGYTTSQSLVDKWAGSNATSSVINALIYSQAAIGVFQEEPTEDGAEGKYYYALLVIG